MPSNRLRAELRFKPKQAKTIIVVANYWAPRFQPLIFNGASGRCRSRKQTEDILVLVILTSGIPSGLGKERYKKTRNLDLSLLYH